MYDIYVTETLESLNPIFAFCIEDTISSRPISGFDFLDIIYLIKIWIDILLFYIILWN